MPTSRAPSTQYVRVDRELAAEPTELSTRRAMAWMDGKGDIIGNFVLRPFIAAEQRLPASYPEIYAPSHRDPILASAEKRVSISDMHETRGLGHGLPPGPLSEVPDIWHHIATAITGNVTVQPITARRSVAGNSPHPAPSTRVAADGAGPWPAGRSTRYASCGASGQPLAFFIPGRPDRVARNCQRGSPGWLLARCIRTSSSLSADTLDSGDHPNGSSRPYHDHDHTRPRAPRCAACRDVTVLQPHYTWSLTLPRRAASAACARPFSTVKNAVD